MTLSATRDPDWLEAATLVGATRASAGGGAVGLVAPVSEDERPRTEASHSPPPTSTITATRTPNRSIVRCRSRSRTDGALRSAPSPGTATGSRRSMRCHLDGRFSSSASLGNALSRLEEASPVAGGSVRRSARPPRAAREPRAPASGSAPLGTASPRIAVRPGGASRLAVGSLPAGCLAVGSLLAAGLGRLRERRPVSWLGGLAPPSQSGLPLRRAWRLGRLPRPRLPLLSRSFPWRLRLARVAPRRPPLAQPHPRRRRPRRPQRPQRRRPPPSRSLPGRGWWPGRAWLLSSLRRRFRGPRWWSRLRLRSGRCRLPGRRPNRSRRSFLRWRHRSGLARWSGGRWRSGVRRRWRPTLPRRLGRRRCGASWPSLRWRLRSPRGPPWRLGLPPWRGRF